ncbi:Protein MRPS-35 a [Aphelenchoides avenae]|nr:Protein MRPS-35 a [Aphelenchus avenae]
MAATADVNKQETVEQIRARMEQETDAQGEQFRELYIMPKRKLNAQLQLERMTGRAEAEKRYRVDINDRLAVRRPRSEEMAIDQDWPSVWPAAASFKASVVPLPIRMGTRKHPERRAPFKKVGNLELLKIPNFLHLTPEHIRRHCEAIKGFCTPWPKELRENSSLIENYMPITVKYSDFVHQGTSLRDMRARVVTIQVKLSSLALDEHMREKFRRLAGNRYEEATDTLTIVTDRCFSRKQNRDYADFLLTALYHESKKLEKWEGLKERKDHLKVEFAGSSTEQRVLQILTASDKVGQLEAADADVQGQEDVKNTDALKEHPKVKQFVETWNQYRNTPEKPETTRDYAAVTRELLGIPSLTDNKKREATQ